MLTARNRASRLAADERHAAVGDGEGVGGDILFQPRRVLQQRRVLGIEARDGLGRKGGAAAGAPMPSKVRRAEFSVAAKVNGKLRINRLLTPLH